MGIRETRYGQQDGKQENRGMNYCMVSATGVDSVCK